ncbi:hypothetical protein Pint_34281 [Pistacia integerrima]|uniref:Uncharacterized protein n=1 Tax=Pistacia integerrima TaxID=434235 RepID=A0ACC0X7W1_9ROSI|nr:hypothetical protein Pint_34281 [Pistacia integerrima]
MSVHESSFKLSPPTCDSIKSEATSVLDSSSSSCYPLVDMAHVAEKHFPEDDAVSQTTNILPSKNVLVKMPRAIVHLIEREHNVELASGELSIVSLSQGDNVVAIFARMGLQ